MSNHTNAIMFHSYVKSTTFVYNLCSFFIVLLVFHYDLVVLSQHTAFPGNKATKEEVT